MAVDPIPDLLGELRAGRYPFDFVEALTGGELHGGEARRAALLRILREKDAGSVLTNVLLIGARQVLSGMMHEPNGGRRRPEDVGRALERLGAAKTPEDLDKAASNFEALFWT